MRLVHDAQIEVHVTQEIEDVVLTSNKIHRSNTLRRVFPDISPIGCIDSRSVDDTKRLAELVVQFPSPLISQVGWRDDKRTFDQAPEFEFLD